jgi:hypothetical protein
MFGCSEFELWIYKEINLPYSQIEAIYRLWFYSVTTRLEGTGGMVLIRIRKGVRCLLTKVAQKF